MYTFIFLLSIKMILLHIHLTRINTISDMFRRSLLHLERCRQIYFRSSSSSSFLRHNWLEMASEIVPTTSSQPNIQFNEQLIKYLSQSARQTLPSKTEDNLLQSFQDWSPKEFYDLISVLGGYGLQPVDVLRWLTQLPSSDKTIINVDNLKKSFENLLQLQLDSTSRSILVSNDPHLIQYDLSYLRERFDVLHCYFTKREIKKLIRRHRRLFSEIWSDLDYKINYVRIMLFASTRDIVESNVLSHSIAHIRQRYLFVTRCGLYKRVRREDQYLIQKEFNINLEMIFDSSLTRFLKETTNNLLRSDDYQAFIDSLTPEQFDDEFDKYLTLDKTRKKWKSADRHKERQERRYWMSEFDMFNNEPIDDEDETELTIVEEKPLMKITDEIQPSFHHPLSDWNPDRHRRRKLAENADPNIRL